MYAVFAGADFGAGFWSLLAGGGDRGRRPRESDRLGDRAGLGGQPRVADLHARRALDGLLVRVRGDLLDAVHPAEPRCARDRAAGIRIRVPPHRAPRAAAERWRRRSSGSPRCSRPSSWERSSARSQAAACRSATPTGDPVTSWLNPLSLVIGALFVATGAYLAAVFLVSDARRAGAPDLERYFAHPRARRRDRHRGARRGRPRRPAERRTVRLRRAQGRRVAARDPLARLRDRRARRSFAATPDAEPECSRQARSPR